MELRTEILGERAMSNGEFDFARIAFDVRYEGKGNDDGFEYYKWTACVRGYKFPHITGTALVDKQGRPKTPDVKEVMYSILSDMSAGELPFEYFCSEYGYDEDSRKAYAMWEECVRLVTEIMSIFSPDEIEAMQKALEVY